MIRALLVVVACAFFVACSGSTAAANNSASSTLPTFQAAIQKGLVVKGMSLEEASAAGGPHVFAIQRDRKVWPSEDTDPWQILAAQRQHPDNSKIRLLFQNKTQFSTSERVQFTVEFVRGRAVSIKRGWQFFANAP